MKVVRSAVITGSGLFAPDKLKELIAAGHQRIAICLFGDEASVWGAAEIQVFPSWIPTGVDAELWLFDQPRAEFFAELAKNGAAANGPVIHDGRACIWANPRRIENATSADIEEVLPSVDGLPVLSSSINAVTVIAAP